MKKIIYSTLSIAVAFFSIYCCCFSDLAQAKEPDITMPACHHVHQKADETEERECDCQKDAVLISTLDVKSDHAEPDLFFSVVLNNLVNHHFQINNTVNKNGSPPETFHSPPLYIKHATFRI
ncbi:MAG: hypothetical protein KC713_08885 [Candidatus Omnitrophica bacterium]|nr:hypothetical protein [Candidatus Omnitrophota bacterium]